MTNITISLEKEKRFLLLLSSFIVGKNASKKEVLDYIEAKGYIRLTSQEKANKSNRNEAVWRNDLAYVRKHLEMEGLFVSGIRNSWAITENGEQFLFELFQQIQNCTSLSKATDKALFDAKELFCVGEVSLIVPYCDEFPEGRISYRKHVVRERNRELVEMAKLKFKETHNGMLFCEVCGFNFQEKYGSIGENFIEAHHSKPISEMCEGEKTKLQDIVMLCSNCHSMIHRKKPWASIEELKKIYIK